ncbi:NAD(P)H-dependent oxidoreductase [Patescibacteria group bacterium]|nr:NAD(P)H-dependent oxidoreductase [Patescibacteria group bacterium]
MHKKIFILLGHPTTASLSGSVASAYEEGALEAGHEVRRMNVGDMRFDPVLRSGYQKIQELEPDLKTFQANVSWCDHFVIVYPNWWSAMPAVLKGIFDRAWLPGFAYNFYKDGRLGWHKRLRGKSARILVLSNAHPLLTWLFFGEFTNELARATLGFAGIAPVRVKVFSPSEKASPERIGWWLRTVKNWGKRVL